MTEEKKLTVDEKVAMNKWDHLTDVIPTMNRAFKDKTWRWGLNPDCKYIELRIDMRTGCCIIRDRDGKRINPEDFAYQYGGEI